MQIPQNYCGTCFGCNKNAAPCNSCCEQCVCVCHYVSLCVCHFVSVTLCLSLCVFICLDLLVLKNQNLWLTKCMVYIFGVTYSRHYENLVSGRLHIVHQNTLFEDTSFELINYPQFFTHVYIQYKTKLREIRLDDAHSTVQIDYSFIKQ